MVIALTVSLRLHKIKVMTTKRGQGLAAKLKAGIEKQAADAAARKSEAVAQQARMQAEREQLMSDLLDFGEAVEHLSVKQGKKRLTLGFNGESMRFEPLGLEDEVAVSGGRLLAGTRLAMQPELEKWVVHFPGERGQNEQLLLFDGGLERLVSLGLGLTTRTV